MKRSHPFTLRRLRHVVAVAEGGWWGDLEREASELGGQDVLASTSGLLPRASPRGLLDGESARGSIPGDQLDGARTDGFDEGPGKVQHLGRYAAKSHLAWGLITPIQVAGS